MSHSKKPALKDLQGDDDAHQSERATRKVEAEYAHKPVSKKVVFDEQTEPTQQAPKTRKVTEKQLENLRKMRENKLKKTNERRVKQQEEDYTNKILDKILNENVLLERLREKLMKEGRVIDVIDNDEPVKPRSTMKPPKEFTHPREPPKAKEPEAPEPPPPQKPVNPFMYLF